MFFYKLLVLIRKEFLAIWSDKRSRIVIISPPLMQLLLFSFAVNLEVKNISIGILDRDNSVQSKEIIRNLKYSNRFIEIKRLKSEKELTSLVDSQKILASIYIPQNFEKDLFHGKTSIQIIADGRRSNSAQITNGYIITAISKDFSNIKSNLDSLIVRDWYNPNLNNFWWILPNLVGLLSMIVAIILTSLSVAREREVGTFEQTLVSPIPPMVLMLGKIIPPMVISMLEATIIFLAAITAFQVPFNGSVLILYLAMFAFLFSIVGFGLFISSISSTQQQGILGAFVLLVPSVLMSGFATPVENMPSWLIPFTNIVSLKYFLVITKGVFLKNMSLMVAFEYIWPMLLLGVLSLSVASWFFQKKVT
jgi:ABC-2 type transport system permease protein